MKPKNFPGRKAARKARAADRSYVTPPEVADMTFRVGARNRGPDGRGVRK